MALIIKSQADIDNLPAEFSSLTEIHIKCRGVEIRFVPRNGIFVARDNSQVTAYGNSQVTARDDSQVTAYGNSQVTAYGNSQVTAYGNSQVTARDDSQVTACDDSQVTAYGNSQVTAYGNSQVTAYGNSQVTARDDSVCIKGLRHCAILINKGVDVKPVMKDRTAKVVMQKKWLHTKESFLDIYPADKNGMITLYKVTRKDGTDHHTGKLKYEGDVECPDWDGDADRQCGGGLHLSPEPHLALGYHQGPVKKCLVHKDDFVVYPHDISKVRCRKVKVLEEAL